MVIDWASGAVSLAVVWLIFAAANVGMLISVDRKLAKHHEGFYPKPKWFTWITLAWYSAAIVGGPVSTLVLVLLIWAERD